MVANDRETDDRASTNRRRFLKVAGVAGVAGLAGCSGNGGGGGSGGGSGGSDSGGSGGSDDDGSGGSDSGGSGSDGTTTGEMGGGSGDGDAVTIGAIVTNPLHSLIYPLTGNLGEVGQNIQQILDTTVEHVNNGSLSDLGPLVFQGTEGLPNLDNREVNIVWADHRSDPGQGRNEAERLIQSEGVDAIYGSYNSSVTKTVSAVCDREGVPHITGESSSPDLTERGLDWFWRSGPHDGTFSQNMFAFFDGLNENQDAGIESVAIIHEDTEYGSTSASVQEELANEHGYEIVAGPISYTAESVTTFTSQLNRIRQADPDVLLPTSYVRDATLMAEDMQSMGYFPDMVMAQNSGHNEPSFVEQTELSNYFCTRSTFADDMTESVPEIGTYNQWVTDQTDISLNGVYIRSWGGLLTLLKGIDTAGGTAPGEIQSALNGLELERLTTGLPFGIQFQENGQNGLASGVLNQYHDGEALMVWPFDLAQDDTLTFPAPNWDER
jgi:branched-chain amino acid transport system substrate-binding protein